MGKLPEDDTHADPEIHAQGGLGGVAEHPSVAGASLISAGSTLLRHPRLMAWVPFLIAVAAVAVALLRGREYSAESQFEPRSPGMQALPFAGIAAQFGFSLEGLAGGGEGVEFYAKVLKSKALLRKAVQTDYRFSDHDLGEEGGDSLSGTLVDLLDIRGKAEGRRLIRAVRRIDAKVSARADLRAGLVVLRTRAPWPELAVQLNRRLLELLNTFNLETRQSLAAAERRFVEERLEAVRGEYEEAEEELLLFLQQNRLYRDSPELMLEVERLQRQVNHHLQIYTTLRQAYEQARIDEVRNTPVITVVEPPEATVERVGGLVLYGILGLMVGVMVAVGAAFVTEHLWRQRELHPEEHTEFEELRRGVRRKLLPATFIRKSRPG